MARGSMKNTTQCERLLDYLKSNGSVEPLEAWEELGIYRLSSRICDLRQDGHSISSGRTTAYNSYGEEVKFARYTLEAVA